MNRVLIVFGGALLGVVMLANAGMAQRSDPVKAKKYQATLVTAYKQCAVSNDLIAGSLSFPACHPAVPDDDTCTIDAQGGGKVQAKVSPAGGDVALKIKLKGIGGCDGELLEAVATMRITTNDCVSADPLGCTSLDLIDLPLSTTGSCVIAKGTCQIKTTVNTELGPGAIPAAEDVTMAINSIALERLSGNGTPGKVAVAGLGIP